MDKMGVAIDASPISMSKEANAKKVETYMEAIDQL